MKELFRSKRVVLGVDADQWQVAGVSVVPEFKEDGTPNESAGSEIQTRRRFYSTLESAMKAVCERVRRVRRVISANT